MYTGMEFLPNLQIASPIARPDLVMCSKLKKEQVLQMTEDLLNIIAKVINMYLH